MDERRDQSEASRPTSAGSSPDAEDHISESPREGPTTPPTEPTGSTESGPDIFQLDAPPTDDAPTVISKTVPRAERPEDAFAVKLRGRFLAHFELLEPIGIGGMAAVIRAQDTQLDRPVALKILPPEMAADPENIRRFHHEARAAAKLDHENIARVFYCGEDQGLHFIAFEFVEGENLRTILERRGRIPLPEAISYMLQVATGLDHAASRGVVHRDIKPSNIIVTPTGRAKLVDMGLARSLEPRSDGQLTQSGVTLGTFDYISPEQALEPRDADVRSDIYSLGCTFYHMLTGQPPVPEGTAARKLNFHQHEAPIDPRQLNPAIPDEVAAILARMMAKDPKDRYQKPEHLVQHLILVAQKIGAAVESPRGVLFVDAPLPSPPGARPMLIGAAAAALLVVLVLALGMWSEPAASDLVISPPQPSVSQAREVAPNGQRTWPEVPVEPPKEHAGPAVEGSERTVVRTVRELADALQQPVARIVLANSLDLSRRDGGGGPPGLVFQGTELTIEPEQPNRRPTLRLAYDVTSAARPDQTWPILTIKSGRVTLRGVRFETDAAGTETPLAAIALWSAEQCRLEGCEFVQTGSPEAPEQRRQSAILVRGPIHRDGKRPALILEDCFFHAGHAALTLTGAVFVKAKNIAFAPHDVLFDVRGPSPATDLVLEHCSAFIDSDGVAFDVDATAHCQLEVFYSLFSGPPAMSGDDSRGGTLLRLAGEPTGKFTYSGKHRNVYYNLGRFQVKEASRGNPVVWTTLEAFRQAPGIKESANSLELSASPWRADNPLELLATNPREAFLVQVRQPELRPVANPTAGVIGVERGIWGASYSAEDLLRLDERKLDLARRPRIVDPSPDRDAGSYPSLGHAILDARPGDEIQIKHTGLLKVDAVSLTRPDVDLTIKPYPGCQPILELGETTDTDAALFRVYDGQLHLEQLQFVVRPTAEADWKAQAVVSIVGVGLCTFKECVATLRKLETVPVSFVVLADPAAYKRMGPATSRTAPRLELKRCFIRGEGDLVAVRSSRRFELSLDESLLALEGSMLIVEGDPRGVSSRPAAQISLSRVTAYLSDYLVWLRAPKDLRGLVATEVRPAMHCLFVAAAGKPLVHIDGLDVDSDEQLQRFFTWSGGRHNLYSGFSHFLEQEPPSLPPFDRNKWSSFTNEDETYSRARLFHAGLDRPLARSLPGMFRLKPDFDLAEGEFGPDIDRLPKPAEEETAESRLPGGP
ncbi:MAG: serine/threonine protein kinase [Gemmataceae bacterium]|nr:serine/threonine protein kinase [Gemmataceae bacterium]MDW8265107.1 serine/threonine-protein kinase [Gemmataceae bacterium]